LAGKAVCLLSTQLQQSWIVDSGATDHITPHLHLFHSFSPMTKVCSITMPNGRQVAVKHVGTVMLHPNIILQGVLHVPDFHFNLLSASKLAKQLSCGVVFTANSCYLQDHLRSKQQVLGEEKGGLYLAQPHTTSLPNHSSFLSVSEL